MGLQKKHPEKENIPNKNKVQYKSQNLKKERFGGESENKGG